MNEFDECQTCETTGYVYIGFGKNDVKECTECDNGYIDTKKVMTVGEMAVWTKRLNEVRSIKDGYFRGQRMRNLWNDFTEVYREKLNETNDRILLTLYRTIDQEYFMHV